MKNKILSIVDWEKVNGLIPVIIQDNTTSQVLMLGYMNYEALDKTEKTKFVWFYSRTKKRLWMKGETSGNTLKVVLTSLDCDNDTILIKALANGPTCHTGEVSCFPIKEKANEIDELFKTIILRKNSPTKKSYTTRLFEGGIYKICLKVAEESLEVVQAATKQTKRRVVEETVDLLYHIFVLLALKQINLEQINKEIKKRKK